MAYSCSMSHKVVSAFHWCQSRRLCKCFEAVSLHLSGNTVATKSWKQTMILHVTSTKRAWPCQLNQKKKYINLSRFSKTSENVVLSFSEQPFQKQQKQIADLCQKKKCRVFVPTKPPQYARTLFHMPMHTCSLFDQWCQCPHQSEREACDNSGCNWRNISPWFLNLTLKVVN